MTTTFPGAIDSYTLNVDGVDTVYASDVNDLNDAVVAIETCIGSEGNQSLCEGRLTLATASPVTQSDLTAKTTLYFTPYLGNRVSLHNGTGWITHTFTERSIAIPGTTDTNYDVYLYNNAGTLTLELVAWTNATTRATAIALQDGIYIKNGDTTRKYLGTIRTTAVSGECEDSLVNRFVWNKYNKIPRTFLKSDATGHTTNTAIWRQFRATAADKVAVVIGVAETMAEFSLVVDVAAGAGGWYAGSIGYDTTTTPSAATYYLTFSTARSGILTAFRHYPAVGYHEYNMLEITSGATATVTAGHILGSIWQ